MSYLENKLLNKIRNLINQHCTHKATRKHDLLNAKTKFNALRAPRRPLCAVSVAGILQEIAGRNGATLKVFGVRFAASGALLRPSCGHPVAILVHLGPSCGHLWGRLEHFGANLGPARDHLEAIVGPFGPS